MQQETDSKQALFVCLFVCLLQAARGSMPRSGHFNAPCTALSSISYLSLYHNTHHSQINGTTNSIWL
jgi:hypothetical protein